MSVQETLDLDLNVDVALDERENVATATVTFDIDHVFDDDGELRLWETADGWEGFQREGGAIYYRNTLAGEPVDRLRVGERAVRLAIAEQIQNPTAVGPGRFVRGPSYPLSRRFLLVRFLGSNFEDMNTRC